MNAALGRVRLGPELRFALTFFGLAAVLFAVYTFPYAELGIRETWFAAYFESYARAVRVLIACFDPSAVTSGSKVIGTFAIEIAKNCDAMELNILFAAAALALPAPWRRRVLATVAGLVSIAGINLLRICSLYFIGIHWPAMFDFAHLELWPLLLVAFGVVEFLLWANWMAPRAASAAHAS